MERKEKATQRAVYDAERKGILIPESQLRGSPFSFGDRFAVRQGKRELFTLTLILDPAGDIPFDRTGIFIERTRRVDALIGGIFDEFTVHLPATPEGRIVVKPENLDLDGVQRT